MQSNPIHNNLFGDLSPDSLKSMAANYPYFSPVHYLRLKQMAEDDPERESLAGLAALHFRDPLRLQIRLSNDLNQESRAPGTEARIPQPVADTATDLLFEPLHATDYFASQGIKLSRETAENDKLGKQLRSFTDWLKTMKRLPAAEIVARIPVDKKVEKMAEMSDRQVEVVTEAMAEVLADQGKNDKAIEIYRKLSLQNPSKLSYFAEKIEDLKNK